MSGEIRVKVWLIGDIMQYSHDKSFSKRHGVKPKEAEIKYR